MTEHRAIIAAVGLLVLWGCASAPPKHARAQEPPPFRSATAMLLPYAASDGSLSRVQLRDGLKRDFDKADVNHSGFLDANEVRAINQQRWRDDASTASPLIDFKNSGCLDFDEYSATALSLFDMLDANGTGKLTAQQLKPKPAAGQKDQPSDDSQGHHRHGGSEGAD